MTGSQLGRGEGRRSAGRDSDHLLSGSGANPATRRVEWPPYPQPFPCRVPVNRGVALGGDPRDRAGREPNPTRSRGRGACARRGLNSRVLLAGRLHPPPPQKVSGTARPGGSLLTAWRQRRPCDCQACASCLRRRLSTGRRGPLRREAVRNGEPTRGPIAQLTVDKEDNPPKGQNCPLGAHGRLFVAGKRENNPWSLSEGGKPRSYGGPDPGARGLPILF